MNPASTGGRFPHLQARLHRFAAQLTEGAIVRDADARVFGEPLWAAQRTQRGDGLGGCHASA